MQQATIARRSGDVGFAIILIGYTLPWASYTLPTGDGGSLVQYIWNGWAVIGGNFGYGEQTIPGILFSIVMLAPLWLGGFNVLRRGSRHIWVSLLSFAFALLIFAYFCLLIFNLNADNEFQSQPTMYGPGLPVLLIGILLSAGSNVWFTLKRRSLSQQPLSHPTLIETR